MERYVILLETFNGLRNEGYTEDLNLSQNRLKCRSGQFKVFASIQ